MPWKKHLLVCLLLILAHIAIFTQRGGWMDTLGPGDEPHYVQKADGFWHAGARTGMTWSPGYVALMSPFVGLLGKEVGYTVWRFVVFGGVSILAYLAFARMFGSLWYGAVLGLCAQLFWATYTAPSLQMLAAAILLGCMLMLQRSTRWVGFVLSLLLSSIFVSGIFSTIFAAFLAGCLVFAPRSLFTRRCALQFSTCIVVFALMALTHGYEISTYPQQALDRGRSGLHHQISLFIFNSGRSTAYLNPGETVPDTYRGHLDAIERYYLDKFGHTEGYLRTHRMDDTWPAFLLNWPWLAEKDPDLMREYGGLNLQTLVDSLYNAFQVNLPFGTFDLNETSFLRGNYHAWLAALLLLPALASLALRRSPPWLPSWPSRLPLLLALSSTSILVPIMLIKPLLLYFPPLIPAYLTGAGLVSAGLARGARNALGRLGKGR